MNLPRDVHDLEISEERRAFLAQHWSLVRFEVPSAQEGSEFQYYLVGLLRDFMLWLTPDNEADATMMENHPTWNGNEGGIGLHVHGVYISHCKMYLFDGREESRSPYSEFQPWKGVIFRDHDSQSNTLKVFLIADAFERFLKQKGLEHTRHNAKKT